VARGDSLWLIAKRNGLSVKELATLNGIPADGRIRVGQVLKLPLSASAQATVAQGSAVPSIQPSGDAYTVRQGDTLSGIAVACGTSVQQLQQLNHLQGTKIVAGQKLLVPAGSATRLQAPATQAKPLHVAPAQAALQDADGSGTYTVRPGETLSDIAQKCGVKVSDLVAWNHISDPRKLRAGQKLVLRGTTAPAQPVASVTDPVQQEPHSALPEAAVPISPQAAVPSAVPSDDELFDDEVMFSEVGSIPVVTVQPQD
jgi:LysM repeat protein